MNDKALLRNSSEIIRVCATFDFQKMFNCPHGDVGLFYYKRNLSVYNFTAFEVGKKERTCFMWSECTGKRGANEVSSCLLQFVKKSYNKVPRNSYSGLITARVKSAIM